MKIKYASELKIELIERYKSGETITNLSKKYSIPRTSIYHWVDMLVEKPAKEFSLTKRNVYDIQFKLERLELINDIQHFVISSLGIPKERKIELVWLWTGIGRRFTNKCAGHLTQGFAFFIAWRLLKERTTMSVFLDPDEPGWKSLPDEFGKIFLAQGLGFNQRQQKLFFPIVFFENVDNFFPEQVIYLDHPVTGFPADLLESPIKI